jgi:hypothetical protein
VSLVRSFGGEFEVSSDGQQFLFVRSGGGPTRPGLNVVLNWTTELVRLIERE